MLSFSLEGPKRRPKIEPKWPEPYYTFDETFSYGSN